MSFLRYKIVETERVTDKALEEIINEWVGQGWELDSFQFVTHESSRRPVMAFIMFTSPPEEDDFEEEIIEDDSAAN